MRAALEALLDHYLRLVHSGDAGNWDPEEEAVVQQARIALHSSALRSADGMPCHCNGQSPHTHHSGLRALREGA